MVTPTLVSLAALAVLPDEVPEGGLDLGEFYRQSPVSLRGSYPCGYRRFLAESA
jgi:hypothetical protein